MKFSLTLAAYVRQPPIEAVVFGWGVAEDGQLVRLSISTLTLVCIYPSQAHT